MADRIRVEPMDLPPGHSRPWTARYDPGVPPSLQYPDVPLHALLEDAARSRTDAIATIYFGAKRTYRSLQRDATFFSAGLRSLGVMKGDRVALMLPNMPQFLIACFGALRLGAVVVPCDPRSTPRELQQRLVDCEAETIVVVSRTYPTVRAARTGTALRHVIVTGLADGLPPLTRLALLAGRPRVPVRWQDDPGTVAFSGLLKDAGEPVAAPVSPADIAVLQYTGGTMGVPEGALLSHKALVANALQCRAWLPNLRDGQDTIVAAAPLCEPYGLTVAMGLAVQSASALVLEPALDVRRLLAAVQRQRAKVLVGVPRLYDAIASSSLDARYDLRSLEACVSSSAPLAGWTMRRIRELTAGRLALGYGLTEAAALTHCTPVGGAALQRPGSVGLPLPDVESMVVDLETGRRELAPGEIGELVVRGPQLMDGYHKRPAQTAERIRDGWLFTGDVARVDDEGYVFIIGRKQEVLRISGANVYPREI